MQAIIFQAHGRPYFPHSFYRIKLSATNFMKMHYIWSFRFQNWSIFHVEFVKFSAIYSREANNSGAQYLYCIFLKYLQAIFMNYKFSSCQLLYQESARVLYWLY